MDSLLQEERYDKAFATMVESLTCIKMFAMVRESIEIALLMDFMNGLRKVSSKHLVVRSKKLQNTIMKLILMRKTQVPLIPDEVPGQ